MERKQHDEQFKAQVRAEYLRGALGYKKLAKKYGVTRDVIRGILLAGRRGSTMKIDLEKELAVFKPSGDKELDHYKHACATGWSMRKDLNRKLKSSNKIKKNSSAYNQGFTQKEIPGEKDL
ncbi:transposase [Treponema phagedenis]|uniref:transposase n=1 Tax=Treponema phagedenis TaxID=162 RepID=UPI00158256EE|nr:transposase [Treponema phagedenis]QKS91263.1 transposase [Treponema phagedenis]